MYLDGSEPTYIRAVSKQTGATGTAAPSLCEPDFKIQWAKKHLDTLKTSIERFNELYPYEIRTEEEPKSGQYIIRIIHPPILEALDAVLAFGDFIACLRTSLDYLAWQLVLIANCTPSRETSFPICDRNTIDNQVRLAKATFGIQEEAIFIIKSFQPYHYKEDFKQSHLWRLHKLWNIDKHRHIAPFTALPPWQVLIRQGYAGELPNPEQIDNCTVVRVPAAAKDYVELNPERRVDLRFCDDTEGIDVGYQDLFEIYEFVAKTVIPAFENFFPHSEGQS